jgi:hypothetical protein
VKIVRMELDAVRGETLRRLEAEDAADVGARIHRAAVTVELEDEEVHRLEGAKHAIDAIREVLHSRGPLSPVGSASTWIGDDQACSSVSERHSSSSDRFRRFRRRPVPRLTDREVSGP